MICWRRHSNSVNTGSSLSNISDVKTRKRRNMIGIDMIQNNRILHRCPLNVYRFFSKLRVFSQSMLIPLIRIFTYTGVQHDFHFRWCSCRLAVTRRVSPMWQELLTIPVHMNSPPFFNVIRVTRSLALCVCFVDRCLSFCSLTFGHCVVCPFSIFGFWYYYINDFRLKFCLSTKM
jgi:hypothetical protein